jgi:predicted DNA-binding transcriptional regulator AlpA
MLATDIPIPNKTADAGHANRLIGVADVRKMFGDISDMTLWRWLNDVDLEFPKPIYVQRRRFWREAELIDWIGNRPTEI